MKKKILLSVLYMLAGPVFVLGTLPFYNWSATGGIMTMILASAAGILSVWKPRKKKLVEGFDWAKGEKTKKFQ